MKVLALFLSDEDGAFTATWVLGRFSYWTWHLLFWLSRPWDLLFTDPQSWRCSTQMWPVIFFYNRYCRLNSVPLEIIASALTHWGISSSFMQTTLFIFSVFGTVTHYRNSVSVTLSKNGEEWTKSHVKVFPVQISHLFNSLNWLKETCCVFAC